MYEIIDVKAKEEIKAGGEQEMRKNLRVKSKIYNKKLNNKTENKDKYA
mgnify:CR=1 FL=1